VKVLLLFDELFFSVHLKVLIALKVLTGITAVEVVHIKMDWVKEV